MYKVERISVSYIESERIDVQGSRKKVQRYYDEGYEKQMYRNGFWRFIKPGHINVTAYYGENGTCTEDMKDKILDQYNRKKISEKLAVDFASDFGKGKFALETDGAEIYIVEPNSVEITIVCN